MAEEKQKVKSRIKATGKRVKDNVKREVLLNVPNTLTLIRLIFTFILIYLILIDSSKYLIGILFVIAAASDWLDGFFARKLKQTTKIGARLDQVIDRLFMIPIIIVLIIKTYSIDKTLLFMLIFCLSREIVGTPGFVLRIIAEKDSYQVKYIGKITTFLQSVAIALLIFRFTFAGANILTWAFVIATGVIGILSGFDYLRDSLKVEESDKK